MLFRYPWPSWACLRYTTSKYYDMKSSFGHYWLESILSYLYHYITYGNAKQTGLFSLSRISWYLSNSFHMVLYCDETALCFLSFAYFVLWSSFLLITTCNHACVASVLLVSLNYMAYYDCYQSFCSHLNKIQYNWQSEHTLHVVEKLFFPSWRQQHD